MEGSWPDTLFWPLCSFVICSFEKYSSMTVRNKLTINEIPGTLDLKLLVFLNSLQ